MLVIQRSLLRVAYVKLNVICTVDWKEVLTHSSRILIHKFTTRIFKIADISIILQLQNSTSMDIKALDKALQEIAKRRMELSKIDYNNPKYDELEEQLHDLEDNLQDKYG